MTFPRVSVEVSKQRRQICSCLTRVSIRFLMSLPFKPFGEKSVPMGKESLLSSVVTTAALASTTNALRISFGSGIGLFFTYARSTGNISPTSSLTRLSNCNPGLRLNPSVARAAGISSCYLVSSRG